jgi:hypothetical protein
LSLSVRKWPLPIMMRHLRSSPGAPDTEGNRGQPPSSDATYAPRPEERCVASAVAPRSSPSRHSWCLPPMSQARQLPVGTGGQAAGAGRDTGTAFGAVGVVRGVARTSHRPELLEPGGKPASWARAVQMRTLKARDAHAH